MSVEGFVHSWEIAAGLDGPGWRFLLFTSGCPLRCGFCHNPDTWIAKDGERTDSDAVMAEIAKFAPSLRQAKGGVTLSGGEPLSQQRFTADILARAKQMGLTTAIETTGASGDHTDPAILDNLDLVMLDLKAGREPTYRGLTHHDMAPSRAFARLVAARGIPLWLRFVLIPDRTDTVAEWAPLADLALELRAERLEVLPFHQMGAAKWEALGRLYDFADIPAADLDEVALALDYFHGRGVTAY